MLTLRNTTPPEYDSAKEDSLNWKPTKDEYKKLEAASFCCSSCGFVATPRASVCPSGYMELVDIDGKTKVLCAICAQSQYLTRPINGVNNHGLIIYAPGMTQGHITHLARTLYVSRYKDDANTERSRALISKITSELVNPVSEMIHDFESGSAREFGNILTSLPPKANKNIGPLLECLRYWPYFEVFEMQVALWSEV